MKASSQRRTRRPVKLSGDPNALYERHVNFDHVVPDSETTARDKYEAIARSVRDVLSQCWLKTEQTYRQRNPKRVYYLSMEFLLGRMLANNIANLRLDNEAQQFARHHQIDPLSIIEQEPDAGLGNGGLGRLAACFLDSMATLGIPGMGYGLRYEYGMFRQHLRDGWQNEQPDHWLERRDPWEVARPNEAVEVKLSVSFELHGGALRIVRDRPSSLIGIPFDRPVVGYGGRTINTLRLWAAQASNDFDFAQFSSGDFIGALAETLTAETLTRVLYPDDHTMEGRGLRFLQEYFLVAFSLADLVRRFRAAGNAWSALPDQAAIQLNDTHPAIAVPELMRILLDDAGLGWEEAWDLTRRTLAYTNHTLLPEALEKWPVQWFQDFQPRLLEITYEINRRFLDDVRARYPGDEDRVARVSLIEEGAPRQVRMAHLAIIGSHSTNGVAALHSDLLKKRVVPDFAAMFPERFNNKTNGVTPRRWLLLANPALAAVITEAIGDGWIADLAQLEKLKPLAQDKAFCVAVRKAKRDAKTRFLRWLDMPEIDPDSMFDTQIKRIHEYKRQLLNALHIVVLYHRLRENPRLDVPPRTFFFAGKAAPAYHFAKLVIKFINNLAGMLDGDPVARGRLKVVFVPDYRVSVAEYLIPASDVSEQISTAGYEASGTSNMKFMMNGALTIGTRDGATIEMAEAAGEENFFLFGLNAEQVEGSRGWYNPRWHYENEPETRAALDLISDDHFSRNEPGVFAPILDALLRHGDHYRHLADLADYARAHQRLGDVYRDPAAWTRQAILNIAASGRFSSDRTITEYAKEIWEVPPCPVP
jgi:starch phosphorylase